MMTSDDRSRAPLVVPEPGWTPVEPFPLLEALKSFVSGDPGGPRLRVSYFRRDADGHIVGKAWFGPGAEGPPGIAHGGSVAAVLDEAMGAACWQAGHPSLAVRLTIDFRAMVPLGTDATFEAWLDEVNGRKVSAHARLIDAAGHVLAGGEALYITLSQEQIAAVGAALGDRGVA